MNKTANIIRFVAFNQLHCREVKFTDLQRFIVEMNGLDYDEKIKYFDGKKYVTVRKYRGYYSTCLKNRFIGESKFLIKTKNGYIVTNKGREYLLNQYLKDSGYDSVKVKL